jgi:hypothetical protein
VRARQAHTCDQCRTTFCAARSDAHFCSPRCRKRHERGLPPANTSPQTLRTFLEKHGFAQGGALSVSAGVALAEVNASLKNLQSRGLKTVLQPFTEVGFRSALRDAGVAAA